MPAPARPAPAWPVRRAQARLPLPLSPAARLPWEGSDVEEPANTLPSLSLVLPVLNAGATLERTLRSLACQDLAGVELILMDGGSSDDTLAVARHYADLFARVSSAPDRGQSDAINKGFALATGEILGWLCGDDLLLPGALAAARTAFADGGPEVVVGDGVLTDLSLAPRGHYRFSQDTLTFAHLLDYGAHHLVQPAVFFSRTAWEFAGPLEEALHYAMDADLFLRLARHFAFRHVAQELALSVTHDGAKTVRHRAASLAELALVIARHGGLEEARGVLALMTQAVRDEAAAAAPAAAAAALGARRRAAEAAEAEANRALLHRLL